MRRPKALKASRFGAFLCSTLSWWRKATISASRSHGEVDSDRRSGRVRLRLPTLETAMQLIADRPEAASAIRSDLGAIFISLELSRSTWLITSLSPGGGEKMSKHSVPAGDICVLLARFLELRQKAFARTGKSFPVIVVQEAGLDGFWMVTVCVRPPHSRTKRVPGVGPAPSLFRYQRQTKLLAHHAGKEATDRVLLPAGCLDDGGDRCSLGLPQQSKDGLLLRSAAGPNRGVCSEASRALSRRSWRARSWLLSRIRQMAHNFVGF
jgi:hypothetical protein